MEENHTQLLKQHNLSVTSARLAILWALENFPHSDAETILKKVKKRVSVLSKQAVYDNLHALKEKGLIRVIQPMGHAARYETRICDNHHHIVCRSCDATMDVDCATERKPCLKPSEKSGFIIDEAEIIFWGTCPACQKRQHRKKES